jgi:hypothetical protein
MAQKTQVIVQKLYKGKVKQATHEIEEKVTSLTVQGVAEIVEA